MVLALKCRKIIAGGCREYLKNLLLCKLFAHLNVYEVLRNSVRRVFTIVMSKMSINFLTLHDLTCVFMKPYHLSMMAKFLIDNEIAQGRRVSDPHVP